METLSNREIINFAIVQGRAGHSSSIHEVVAAYRGHRLGPLLKVITHANRKAGRGKGTAPSRVADIIQHPSTLEDRECQHIDSGNPRVVLQAAIREARDFMDWCYHF